MQKIQWRHSWTVTPKSPWHLPFSGPWGELLLRPATFCSASLYMARTEKDPISSATAARLVFFITAKRSCVEQFIPDRKSFHKVLFREPGSQFQQNTEKMECSESRNLFSIFYPLDVQYISKKKCMFLFSADALQPHPENLECCCSSLFSRLSVSFMNRPLLQIRSRWCRHPSVAGMVFECNDSLSCQRPTPVQ